MTETEALIINEISHQLSDKPIVKFVEENQLNSNNKSYVSVLIRNYLSIKTIYNESVLIDYKINLKVIPVSENYICYEALSFPFGSLYNLVFEEWETEDEFLEAELKKKLKNIFVLIPVIKIKNRDRYNDFKDWKIGKISVWKPNKDELMEIGKEWIKAKDIVINGIKITREPFGKGYRMKNNLLKQSCSKYIHLRPHAINSFDYDKPYKKYTQGKIEVTKQSFWLNKKYINHLLEKYKWKQNSKEE